MTEKKRIKSNYLSFLSRSLFQQQQQQQQQQRVQESKNPFSSSPATSSNSEYSSDKTTHFGYQTVSEKEKHENGR